MPRQFGKIDLSARWEPCGRCRIRHAATAPCTRFGIWLVASMCRDCTPSPHGTHYCSRHDAHVR